jgi:hypothetical protein
MNSASPIAVIRAELTIMIDWAGLEMAMRFGRPNSKIAYSALKNGISPPKVRAVATRRGGTCRRAKLANITMRTERLEAVKAVGAIWSGEACRVENDMAAG